MIKMNFDDYCSLWTESVSLYHEQTVDDLEAENKRLAEQHCRELKTFEETLEKKHNQLTDTHDLTVQDLINRHDQDLLAAKKHAEDELANLQQVVYCILFDSDMLD